MVFMSAKSEMAKKKKEVVSSEPETSESESGEESDNTVCSQVSAKMYEDSQREVKVLKAQLEELRRELLDMKAARSPNRKRRQGTPSKNEEGKLELENRFASLMDTAEDEQEEVVQESAKSSTESMKSRIFNRPPKEAVCAPKNVQQKVLTKPLAKTGEKRVVLDARIIVEKCRTKEVVEVLKPAGITAQFALQRNGTTVLKCEAAKKEEVKEALKATRHEGFSFVTKQERVHSTIMKGVDASFSPEEVKEELKMELEGKGLTLGNYQVDRFETMASKRRGVRLPMFIIRTEDKPTMDAITAITTLCYSRVEWDKTRKPLVTQCMNCFAFGHSMSGGCFRPRQCKRCPGKGEHNCKVAPLDDTDEDGNRQERYRDYQCSNCLEKGHPPTWTGCRMFKEAIERAENRRETNRGKTLNKYVDAPVVPNQWKRSITERIMRTTSEAPTPTRAAVAQGSLEEMIEKELGVSVDAIQSAAEAFMSRYAKLTTREEKVKEVALYYLQVAGWRP